MAGSPRATTAVRGAATARSAACTEAEQERTRGSGRLLLAVTEARWKQACWPEVWGSPRARTPLRRPAGACHGGVFTPLARQAAWVLCVADARSGSDRGCCCGATRDRGGDAVPNAPTGSTRPLDAAGGLEVGLPLVGSTPSRSQVEVRRSALAFVPRVPGCCSPSRLGSSPNVGPCRLAGMASEQTPAVELESPYSARVVRDSSKAAPAPRLVAVGPCGSGESASNRVTNLAARRSRPHIRLSLVPFSQTTACRSGSRRPQLVNPGGCGKIGLRHFRGLLCARPQQHGGSWASRVRTAS